MYTGLGFLLGHDTASTCLVPQYDDMKPKLKRNKLGITKCSDVVLTAHALDVGGPRVKLQSRNWPWCHFGVPQSTKASAKIL
jgi:hypothetical protein